MKETSDFKVTYFMKSPNYELQHSITTKPLHITYHNHDFYEVFYFISGNVKYMIEGTVYHLKPGDILLTHNKEMHKPILDFSVPYERYVLWIDPMYIKALGNISVNLSTCFEQAAQNNSHLLRPTSSMQTLISNLFKNLEVMNSDNSFGNALLKKSYITALLIYLNRISEENCYEIEYEKDYDPRINDIIKYINNNIQDQITLDDIAEQFYLSKYHLCRLFKKSVGLTIYQYIIKKRLIIAKSILISGSSVRSAFLGSGFSDYSNFIKSFKSEFGVLPKNISTNMNRDMT
jgi:AraC-like DNA-binding protein